LPSATKSCRNDYDKEVYNGDIGYVEAIDLEVGEMTIVTTRHHMMLQRNLLYTGVTRGKRLVILLGQKKAAAKTARRTLRPRWNWPGFTPPHWPVFIPPLTCQPAPAQLTISST
jgi:ATP-dependent exoDNAse (exonuclease V) alpha subunit